jgi:predicted dehydrogenase
MKRYDEAYEALLADLERDRPQLLYVGALTSEGRELPRTFNSTPVPRADDVAPALLARWQESERRQMSQAIGTTDPRAVGVFSGLFLADLVHDVNLILGILGVADASPAADPGSRHWNDGRAGVLDFSTPAGVGCTIAYAEIPGASEYDEQISVVTDAGVYRLRFPPPYLLRAPTLYERRVQVRSRVHTSTVRSYSEPFVAELAAFHASVTHGVACRTPAAQAAEDLELLERAFRAGG